jgi:hypothetical protein
MVKLKDTGYNLDILLNSGEFSSSFESDTTYLTSLKIKNIVFKMKDNKANNGELILDNAVFNFSSNTQMEDAEVYSKSYIKTVTINVDKNNYSFDDFNYEISLNKLDKKSYIKISKILESVSSKTLNQQQQEEFDKAVINILANGFEFKLVDFSANKISLEKNKEIGGFKIFVFAKLKRDLKLAKDFQKYKNDIQKNITFKMKYSSSQEFYNLINKIYPIELMVGAYKNIKSDKIVFDIEYKNKKFYINNKEMK